MLPNYKNIVLRAIDIKGDRWGWWQNIRLPLAGLKDKIDILHCPAQTSPRLNIIPTIVTIHDLIPMVIGDGCSDSSIRRFRKNIEYTVKNSKKIVTISNFSKKDIISFFPEAKNKISVIYWSATVKRSAGLKDNEYLKKMYGIVSPYFFVFGGSAPRKNTKNIIKAFVKHLYNYPNSEVNLVVAGVKDDDFEAFKYQIDPKGLTPKVKNIGFIPDDDIGVFLNNAICLVYASLYEGFGLPILEAFSCGCPVITSNCSSMPEIADNSAVFVDPDNVESIVGALSRMVRDENLRKQLIEKGLNRVQDFNWDKSVNGFSELLKSFQKG